ncbi:urea transporter [Dasania marina]|uniref:urea transporter n=1 Tax=Dasania marina TaxID=471499 RepID=UPI000377FB4E|nr:urea transporter [Dasania marina]
MIKLPSFRQSTDVLLTGFGQIMLQQNRLTGLFFLAGILVNSLTLFLAAVSASIIAVVTAYSCGFNHQHIAKGYYGFNGALVGLAVFSFFPLTPLALAMLAIGSLLATLLMRLMLASKTLPPFTAPFVISTWLLLIIAQFVGLPLLEARPVANELVIYKAIINGVGQVMFQDQWLVGLLFILGLAFSSRLMVVWALVAAMLGVLLAMLLGLSQELAGAGVYGFNSVLAAMALAGSYNKSIVLPLLAAVLAFAIMQLFHVMAAPALTAPFVLAVWLVMVGKKIVDKFFHLPYVA